MTHFNKKYKIACVPKTKVYLILRIMVRSFNSERNWEKFTEEETLTVGPEDY